MKKLSLDLEQLTVQSYDTTPAAARAERGTVNALSALEPEGDMTPVQFCWVEPVTESQELFCPIICYTPLCPTHDFMECNRVIFP